MMQGYNEGQVKGAASQDDFRQYLKPGMTIVGSMTKSELPNEEAEAVFQKTIEDTFRVVYELDMETAEEQIEYHEWLQNNIASGAIEFFEDGKLSCFRMDVPTPPGYEEEDDDED